VKYARSFPEIYEPQELRNWQKSPLPQQRAKLVKRHEESNQVDQRQPSLKRKSCQPVFRSKQAMPDRVRRHKSETLSEIPSDRWQSQHTLEVLSILRRRFQRGIEGAAGSRCPATDAVGVLTPDPEAPKKLRAFRSYNFSNRSALPWLILCRSSRLTGSASRNFRPTVFGV